MTVPKTLHRLGWLLGVALGLAIATPSAAGAQPSGATCPAPATPLIDESPDILSATTLTPGDLTAWWDSTSQGQPPALGAPIAEVVALYVVEAATEGVRGDLALAQAVHATGYFTSSNTSINNFAGIAQPDGTGAGQRFPDATTGVRAHIQLLKKFAAGNDVDLVHPDVTADAGARATTWRDLGGTWATAPDYWTSLSRLFDTMLRHAGHDIPSPQLELEPTDTDCPPAAPAAPAPPAPPAPPAAQAAPAAPAENGQLSLSKVRGITVHSEIAAQVEAMVGAAAADGVALSGGGYRSNAQQIALRRAHCGTSDYAVYEMPAGQCSPPTARPGRSMHERGLAIDFNDCSSRSTRCYRWLAANAADFGFFNLPSEAWHWSVDGS